MHNACMQISKSGSGRKSYWIDATTHAREWIATATVLKILNQVSMKNIVLIELRDVVGFHSDSSLTDRCGGSFATITWDQYNVPAITLWLTLPVQRVKNNVKINVEAQLKSFRKKKQLSCFKQREAERNTFNFLQLHECSCCYSRILILFFL